MNNKKQFKFIAGDDSSFFKDGLNRHQYYTNSDEDMICIEIFLNTFIQTINSQHKKINALEKTTLYKTVQICNELERTVADYEKEIEKLKKENLLLASSFLKSSLNSQVEEDTKSVNDATLMNRAMELQNKRMEYLQKQVKCLTDEVKVLTDKNQFLSSACELWKEEYFNVVHGSKE